jgi:cytochrome c2
MFLNTDPRVVDMIVRVAGHADDGVFTPMISDTVLYDGCTWLKTDMLEHFKAARVAFSGSILWYASMKDESETSCVYILYVCMYACT